MKAKILIIIGVGALFFSGLAHSGAGWTDYATVDELIPTGHHYYRFRLRVDDNPSGCRNDTWFYQDYKSNGADKMFDILLEAIKANLRLRVYVTGVCNLEGHSEISSIGIIP